MSQMRKNAPFSRGVNAIFYKKVLYLNDQNIAEMKTLMKSQEGHTLFYRKVRIPHTRFSFYKKVSYTTSRFFIRKLVEFLVLDFLIFCGKF